MVTMEGLTPQGSPFAKPKQGPAITPATFRNRGMGGQMNPTYLQGRTPKPPTGVNPMSTGQTAPVITPKPSAMGDNSAMPMNRTPQAAPKTPPQAGGNTLGDVYNFFKSDLQNQANQAKANAITDASARGVYYGTPLTGSEADIDTQYLRGLGQLDAGMYSNEQQNQLARLGMAVNLSMANGQNRPAAPGPLDFSGLGALFATPAQTGTSNPPAAPQSTRQGPVITPKRNGEGYSVPKGAIQ